MVTAWEKGMPARTKVTTGLLSVALSEAAEGVETEETIDASAELSSSESWAWRTY